MYIWSDNVASRGGQEIGSCLTRHLQNHLSDKITHVILYSDSCGGQNRNIKLTMLLKHWLANSNIDFIEQKYFLSGHSYNSCDRKFGVIETAAKNHNVIELPDRWIEVIKNAKEKLPQYVVTRMEMEDFISVVELMKIITNRKVDEQKKKVNWLKMRKIVYDREQPMTIFAYDDTNGMQRIDVKKRKIPEDAMQFSETPLLYPLGNAISNAKFDDLRSN